MNTDKPNNPPAFPTHHNVHDPRTDGFFSEQGMTLRDWFAGKFAAAIISTIHSGEDYNRIKSIAETYNMNTSQWISWQAYKQADAMLSERETQGTK